MAGNVNTAPRRFARIATRFSRLFIRPKSAKNDTADYGVEPNSPLLVVQLPPGQVSDAVQILGYDDTVLAKIDKDGKFVGPSAGTALSNLARGTNGQLIVGQTGADPAWTSVSGDVTLAANGAAALAETCIKYATVTLTAAEILALFTTAKQLVAAPGVNKAIEFVRATISCIYGTAVYTINGSTNLSIKYKDKTGADVSSTRATTGFIDQASNQFSMFQPLTAQLALDANAVNQPLCLALATANPTLGDGTFKVNVAYRVHTLV